MTWREWRDLWKFEKDIVVPHLSITIMCPYFFVWILWHYNRHPFQAWPSCYETGLVAGWRWPWQRQFREKTWAAKSTLPMPLAVYSVMDAVYLARAVRDIGLDEHWEAKPFVGPVVREIVASSPKCADHNYWISSCGACARKALATAIIERAARESIAQELKQLSTNTGNGE